MNYKKARGYLSQSERQFLFEIASKSKTIINVGVEYGASIACFASGSVPGTKIVAIDLIGSDKFEYNLKCDSVDLDEYNISEHLKNSIDIISDEINSSDRKTVIFIKGNSNTIQIDIKADVIFVDGCHWGECLQNDIEKYSSLCTKYLLFHDYSDSPIHAGVKEALDNWRSEHFKKIKQIDTIAVYERIK